MRTNIVEDNFVSHHDEPQVGDAIVNNNPDCKHYESEGIVVKIESLPEDKGKTATYKCTNSGDNWIEGDVLTKTMDQLIPLGDVERVVAELMNGLSSPSMDVEGQIKDLIEEMLQEESRAADELLSPHNAHILNETYITQVLGLQIPLTESYPYTPNFRSQVLHEQLIFEGFWADLKNLKGNTAAIMGAVGVIVKDGSKIGDFIKRIKKGAIDEPFNAIKDFLTNLYEVLKEWAMPTFAKIAEMAKGMLDQVVKIAKKVFSMSGWKQALSIIGFAMAIKFIWDNIGDIVDEGNKKLKAASAMMGALVGGKLKDAMTHAGKLGESDTQTLEKPLLLEDERLDEWGFLNYLFGGEEEEIEEEEISDFDVDGDGEVTPEEVEAHEKEPEQKEKRQERNKNAPAPKIGIALKQGDQITKDGVFLSLDQAKEAGIEGKTPDEIKAAKIDSAKQKAEKIQKKLEDEGHAGEEGAALKEAEKLAEDGKPTEEIVEAMPKTFKEKVQGIIDWLKENVVDLVVNFVKDKLIKGATNFLAGAVSGGVSAFVSGIGKLYGGVKFVTSTIGPHLKGFGKESDEAMKDAKEDPEKLAKELEKNEAVLRQYIRESISAEKAQKKTPKYEAISSRLVVSTR